MTLETLLNIGCVIACGTAVALCRCYYVGAKGLAASPKAEPVRGEFRAMVERDLITHPVQPDPTICREGP